MQGDLGQIFLYQLNMYVKSNSWIFCKTEAKLTLYICSQSILYGQKQSYFKIN